MAGHTGRSLIFCVTVHLQITKIGDEVMKKINRSVNPILKANLLFDKTDTHDQKTRENWLNYMIHQVKDSLLSQNYGS